MAPDTTLRTLYRLKGVRPTIDAMFEVLDHAQLDALDARVDIPNELGVPAIVIDAVFVKAEASWCEDLRRTTGCPVSRPSCRAAGLLMFAVDAEVYAIGYEQGYRLIPDKLKDRRFGLGFAIRRVDPNEVKDLVRQTPGAGKTDITLVPGGASVHAFGIEEHAQVVRHLGGRLSDVRLTVSSRSRARVSSAQGGVGLRLHLGVEGANLIADVREIARVCREEPPRKELEFVEHIIPVKDAELADRLDGVFDDLLGQPDEGRVAVVVPDDHWNDYLEARAFQIRINSRQGRQNEEFDLSYLLDRLRVQRDESRVGALRDGEVTLFKDSRAREDDVLRRTKAIQWVEIDITLEERRFFLLNGEWHEIGPAYLASVRTTVEQLIVAPLSTDLPAWDLAHNERRFCEAVVEHRPGWVCMDGNLVKTRLHRGKGIEVCDVLLPDDTLLMAKHARKDSGPLSHLFKQALVAVQSLQHDPEAVAEFREKVAKAPGGRLLPAGFRPTKVILAILLKDGRELTADTLFPFAQVALVHTAATLRSWGIAVEVVGIRGKACDCEVDIEAA
ncbi:DUF6119 family protein [Streptosporangium sp. NPDC049644]|uniref:TIGR04141 family sporadically distributed protein n=1 Tax=Streptosporangium sp. NPDC049644 TaxID=3155507 RepID=UPI003431BFA2